MSGQKQSARRIVRFVPVRVAQIFQELIELRHVAGRYLHADQYAPGIRAVVAIVEQADIPVRAHLRQEIHQRPRSFGELETVDDFVINLMGMPADQMAERLGIELGDDRDYATAAGHALAILKHLPKEGERFTDKGWRFEIVDMDGRKIDKLLVTEISKPKDEVDGD